MKYVKMRVPEVMSHHWCMGGDHSECVTIPISLENVPTEFVIFGKEMLIASDMYDECSEKGLIIDEFEDSDPELEKLMQEQYSAVVMETH